MHYQNILPMDYKEFNYEPTEFSRSILAGLFAGIAATVISLIYNALVRRVTDFPLSELINVSTIIFILILFVTIAGVVFYLFHHYLKKGTGLFQVAAIVVTVLLISGAMQIQRSPDQVLSKEFRELLSGIIGITGLCTIFIIPFLFKHDYV